MQEKDKLIDKLFSDDCTREDLEQLLRLIEEDPTEVGPDMMVELFKKIGQTGGVENSVSARIFEKVEHGIGERSMATTPGKVSMPSVGNRLYWWFGSAAAIVLLGLCSLWVWDMNREITRHTAYGQIQEIMLPDSSLVVLNGNSSISYNRRWQAGSTRLVRLNGEAYFKVKNYGDGTTKFQVVTSDLTVEVLGTSFNVVSWEEETSVFLEEGLVNVKLDSSTDREVQLKPGEVMRYSAREKKLVPPKAVAKQLEVSWKQGILEFEETSLKDILYRLTSPNNLSYTIANKELSEREFTLRIPTEDMDVALDLLSKLTGTKIEQIDDQLVIEGKTSGNE